VSLAGTVLSLVAGAGSSLAAALQKREALRVDAPVATILGRLARRPLWLAAMALDASAWGVLAAAMALAPIAVVLPLQGAGNALLVPIGIRLLGERYRGGETLAVLAALAGAAVVTAAGAAVETARAPLPAAALWAVAAVAVAGAFLTSRLKSGVACGATAGLLYSGTAIFTKEVGSRFAEEGAGAVTTLALSPTAWLFLMIGLAALAFIQSGFRRDNAAKVASVMTAIATAVPVLAGFLLYGEKLPRGGAGALLASGLALSLAGMVALARRQAATSPA
jgi:drug/metabolite transporter (DMT)-like permease